MISFVGAGPGAADLLTLRAADRLARADVVVWASSLVSEDVLDHAAADAVVHDSAGMTLEDVVDVYQAHPGARVVRLHSGDVSLYSAVQEQVDWCEANGRSWEVVPGVGSLAAASAVVGRELECGVLGDTNLEASVVGEILPKREFYDFEDKYGADSADLAIPADLPEVVAEECRRLAVAAAGALRAEGMARVDFFLEEPGRGLLVNEVNTIPGFTPVSMFPRLWEAAGVPYDQLVDRLVGLALERHARRTGRVGRQR